MTERFSTGRPQFGVHDILPFVQVPKGEQPIALERLEVSVLVVGMFAETTQTMTFHNPNRRPLEGTLVFPLADGAVVSGYAIDVDGELVDGVIVQKKEARRILEAEIRKGVDPGLVEQVQGNVYRTRIYPLPPSGTRTVRIVYVSDLACEGNSAAYHLPLGHAKDIASVSLRVEIKQSEIVPQITGALGNLSLAKLRDGFVAETALPRGTACDDLLVRLPDLPRHLRAVERSDGETFFAVSSAIPDAQTTWSPRRVALLWDASGSRGDVERELELLSALIEAWPQLAVDVRVVRDDIEREVRTFTSRGEREQLLGYLRELPRDGGTGLASLDLNDVPHAQDEAWLVFSDGLATIKRGVPLPGSLPVIAISSSARSDAAYLRHLTNRSGGIYIDLLQTSTESAVQLVATARDSLRVVSATGCEDVHVRQTAGRLAIVGRLTAGVGQVRLAGSGAPDDHISIPQSMAVESHLVARAWAGQETRALAVADPEHPAILELARRHGVVTANASLLVLDTLEQHLEYGIEPAASRKALREQYRAARDRRQRDEQKTKSSHVEQVFALWQTRVRWWETEFKPRPPEKPAVRGDRRAAAPMEMSMASPDAMMALEAGSFDEEAPEEPERPRAMRTMMAAAMPAPAPMAMPAMRPPPGVAPPRTETARAVAKPDDSAPPGATIQIKAWTPDTPYLKKLRASSDAYAAYLRERAAYATSPAFFIDCGDFFLGRGDRELGLRVLSNLLELGLDDPALMRMYAWRLQQAGALDAAIDVFERVRRMRDDEPQSHRDLALALAERWESGRGSNEDATRAMNLLWDVIEKAWERFPEIELIALMELNRLIARARDRDIRTPERIDARFIRLLDLDLRISMSWDLDLTDVDLHVFEPDGEHAYYGHNATSGGGLVSRDFRQGYGPEEYVRRVAQPGVYTIKAHYYGSHQQDIAGACTVIVHVILNFGRANEERQVLTLRLDRPSDQVLVGEVTFARRDPPIDDWRPRFKKLRRGMTIDEISNVVGQPSRIVGSEATVLVYELGGGNVVHVVVAPRLTAVKQIMDGAELDLL